MAREYDLLPACIVSTTWPTAPGSGTTIPAFATQGYVRRGTLLYFVDQPARAITLPSAAGTYYLALTTDTHSTVGSFTRIPGSHYAYLQSASAPTYPDGTTPIASATVASGNITAVDTAPALSPPLSRQTANAVAITGGSATGLTTVAVGGAVFGTSMVTLHNPGAGSITALRSLVTSGTDRWNIFADGTAGNYFGGSVGIGQLSPSYPLDVSGHMRFDGSIGIRTIPSDGVNVQMAYAKGANIHGFWLHQTADTGSGAPVIFTNAAEGVIGSISTTGSATAYNTSSDARLKRNVQPLTDALTTLRQLRPVRFLWNYDDSSGIGFLAHEAQAVIPESVTGLPDQVDAQGNIVPQGMDHSKLVPWLVGALQEVTQRLEALEEALGV